MAGGGCEDILGLGGLTLSPLALLISLTPAGEAFAGRWGRRGCPLGLPCCCPAQRLEAVAGPAFCSFWSEDLPPPPPGKVPRGWRLGWACETSSTFGETKAEDGGSGDSSKDSCPCGQGAGGAEPHHLTVPPAVTSHVRRGSP